MNQQIVNINCKIDVLMNEFNHFKQKYQAQKQMKTKIRTKPKELQSPTLNPKHSNNHIVKLENLLELTKTLLDENEDEQIIKQLLQQKTTSRVKYSVLELPLRKLQLNKYNNLTI
eukprot:TRINITY_DN11841_c0_g1_i1.p1 TRINITY_DN11841_c0_g1~~TRINITY_DN11841_c0_g1_i1.p1  ORF type:complete len:115 (+),score=21.03 TRINITY_DN11841_c0_g1_i1:130-474(+)